MQINKVNKNVLITLNANELRVLLNNHRLQLHTSEDDRAIYTELHGKLHQVHKEIR